MYHIIPSITDKQSIKVKPNNRKKFYDGFISGLGIRLVIFILILVILNLIVRCTRI